MPNECENWIRITGSDILLDPFETKSFDLDTYVPKPDIDKGLPSVAASTWIQQNWGTRWIAPINRTYDEVCLVPVSGGLEAHFISAWAPPVPFYDALVKQYPGLQINYEYAEWEVGFCGYGIGGKEPNHYRFETKDELEELNRARNWHVRLWNPYFVDPT